MYAIVETGGKQYRAAQGDILEVEKLDGEVGSTITLNKVLMISGEGVEPKIGSPAIANATATQPKTTLRSIAERRAGCQPSSQPVIAD